MTVSESLAHEWVEVREEGDAARIVLRPPDYPIPPARGGRRHLVLTPSGRVSSMGAGPADALEAQGSGDWTLEGRILCLRLKGWEGDYEIEEVGRSVLVLRRR